MSILRVKSEWYWQDNYISYISVLSLTMKPGKGNHIHGSHLSTLPKSPFYSSPFLCVPQLVTLVTCCDPIPNMEPQEKMTFSKNPTESFGACLKDPTGWWYTNPSEKWWSSSVGMITFPIYGKIKFMFQTTNQIISDDVMENEKISMFLLRSTSFWQFPYKNSSRTFIFPWLGPCPDNQSSQADLFAWRNTHTNWAVFLLPR